MSSSITLTWLAPTSFAPEFWQWRCIFRLRFLFAALQVWAPTRFAFVIALWDRWKDWQAARAKKKIQQELEKRRAARPTVTAQMVQARDADEPRARSVILTHG